MRIEKENLNSAVCNVKSDHISLARASIGIGVWIGVTYKNKTLLWILAVGGARACVHLCRALYLDNPVEPRARANGTIYYGVIRAEREVGAR
jgi:hypothetical protein